MVPYWDRIEKKLSLNGPWRVRVWRFDVMHYSPGLASLVHLNSYNATNGMVFKGADFIFVRLHGINLQ